MTSSSTPRYSIFFFNDPATTEIYTLSLHDALPISIIAGLRRINKTEILQYNGTFLSLRSEEHTSELQSRRDLVCRLLLEKKKKAFGDDEAATIPVRSVFKCRTEPGLCQQCFDILSP